MQFALLCKYLGSADNKLSFKLLLRDIKFIDLNYFQNESIKSKLLNTVFSSFNSYWRKKPLS